MDTERLLVLDRLSERQRQCLALIAKGFTSKEIGRQLGLSPSTVDNHVRGALQRMNMSDRGEAARLFLKNSDLEKSEAPTVASFLMHRSLLRLPPLGGSPNNLSGRRRAWHIVQIALIGVMGMTAAVMTIAGLVNLFSRI